MRRGGVHGMRPTRAAATDKIVKLVHRDTEMIGIAADIVQRQQAVVHVERGILEAFGHQRPGELLEAHYEMHPLIFLFFGMMVVELEQEKSSDKIEFEQQSRIRRFGALDGHAEPLPVFRAALLGAYITSIHRKKGQHLDKRSFETVKGHIGGVAVPARDAFQKKCEALDISSHVLADDQAFFLDHEHARQCFDAGEAAVELAELSLVLAAAKNAVQII